MPYKDKDNLLEYQRNRISKKYLNNNLMILCSCGCGRELLKYDKYGRMRKGYILGHTNKGKELLEEHKKKISISNKGKNGWNKGKHWANEIKNKISNSNKGKKLSREHRNKLSLAKLGKPSWNKGLKGFIHNKSFKKGHKINLGKKLSEITKKKISERLKGKYIKEKHSHWLGGKSFEPYGIEFNNQLKEQIRARDHYRCQQCFREQDELRTKSNRKCKLSIHHIDFNKKNNNPNNLISLCRNCHMQTNFNREQWIDYFRGKVNKL